MRRGDYGSKFVQGRPPQQRIVGRVNIHHYIPGRDGLLSPAGLPEPGVQANVSFCVDPFSGESHYLLIQRDYLAFL